jgi:hypothetical protein
LPEIEDRTSMLHGVIPSGCVELGGTVCDIAVAVAVHRSDGRLRPFHFKRRLASGGGCTCRKLQQRFSLRAHRYADRMAENRQLALDLG